MKYHDQTKPILFELANKYRSLTDRINNSKDRISRSVLEDDRAGIKSQFEEEYYRSTTMIGVLNRVRIPTSPPIEVLDFPVERNLTNEQSILCDKVSDDLKYSTKYLSKVKNAMERGIDFFLTLSEYKSLFRRKTCAYTGVQLDHSDSNSMFYPTLERIDNNKPYIKSNCVVVSKQANITKSHLLEADYAPFDLDTFFKFADSLREYRDQGKFE
ncbi:hypothetical protein [Vibrio harveyi]|uniref:hypothetical protein n=1 Tax=Vibrio harveyi TaxID=669 RepID=UPI0012BCD2DC|nr:hypothetical protein [Vibrio harveyi]